MQNSDVDESQQFFRALLKDVDAADDQLKRNDSQTNRRTLIRAFFSLVEGAAYTFRRLAIQGLQLTLDCAAHNAHSIKETEPDYEFHRRRYESLKGSYLELAALDDVLLRPSEDGELRKQPNRNPTLNLVALSLRAYGHHQRLGYDCSHCFTRGAGWKKFKAAARIRNRLTHPRRLSELEISDTEIKILRGAMRWYGDTVLDIVQAHKRGLRPATAKDLANAKREARLRRKKPKSLKT